MHFLDILSAILFKFCHRSNSQFPGLFLYWEVERSGSGLKKNNLATKQLNNSNWVNKKVETDFTCFLLVQIKLFNCLVVGCIQNPLTDNITLTASLPSLQILIFVCMSFLTYRWFHENGSFCVHSFNELYLSIPYVKP